MTPNQLEALAERCGQARGPTPSLDDQIAKEMGTGRMVKSNNGYEEGPWGDCEWCVPAYTASIDAAMTLVPEGATVILDCQPPGRKSCAVLGFAPDGDEWHTGAATPALALCAAALRARTLHQGNPHEQ